MGRQSNVSFESYSRHRTSGHLEGARALCPAPHGLEKLWLGDEPPSILHKVAQHLERLGPQVDFLIAGGKHPRARSSATRSAMPSAALAKGRTREGRGR